MVPSPAWGRWDREEKRKPGAEPHNLHFPREQEEQRQFLCWASSIINAEFKHSIGLLWNLAVLLIFSGKVPFSPKKCGAEFFQQHHLKWLEASVFEFAR